MARWMLPLALVLASAAGFVGVNSRARLHFLATFAGRDADYHYLLAEALYEKKLYPEARAACEDALALRKDHLASIALRIEIDIVQDPDKFRGYGRYWESKFGISRADGIDIILDRADRSPGGCYRSEAEIDYVDALESLRLCPASPRKDRQTARALAGLKSLSVR